MILGGWDICKSKWDYETAELKKVGSTGSMLPEHTRLFPGTHETRMHLKGVLIMAFQAIPPLRMAQLMIFPLKYLSSLHNLKILRLICCAIDKKYWVLIKDSDTESWTIFGSGTPQHFFQLCVEKPTYMRGIPKPQHFYAAEWQKWDFGPSGKGPRWALINIILVYFENLGLVDLGFEGSKSKK